MGLFAVQRLRRGSWGAPSVAPFLLHLPALLAFMIHRFQEETWSGRAREPYILRLRFSSAMQGTDGCVEKVGEGFAGLGLLPGAFHTFVLHTRVTLSPLPSQGPAAVEVLTGGSLGSLPGRLRPWAPRCSTQGPGLWGVRNLVWLFRLSIIAPRK